MTSGLILTFAALIAAGFCLAAVYRARAVGRDPRPFAFPVFSLVAFAVMEFLWTISGEPDVVDPLYRYTWSVVDFSLVACIAWLVFVAAKPRR